MKNSGFPARVWVLVVALMMMSSSSNLGIHASPDDVIEAVVRFGGKVFDRIGEMFSGKVALQAESKMTPAARDASRGVRKGGKVYCKIDKKLLNNNNPTPQCGVPTFRAYSNRAMGETTDTDYRSCELLYSWKAISCEILNQSNNPPPQEIWDAMCQVPSSDNQQDPEYTYCYRLRNKPNNNVIPMPGGS